MSDGNPAGGEYSQTRYKLVTTDIESVASETYTPASTGLANPENIYKSGENDRSLWQNAGDTNLTETTGISFSVLKVLVSNYIEKPVEVTVEGTRPKYNNAQ